MQRGHGEVDKQSFRGDRRAREQGRGSGRSSRRVGRRLQNLRLVEKLVQKFLGVHVQISRCSRQITVSGTYESMRTRACVLHEAYTTNYFK